MFRHDAGCFSPNGTRLAFYITNLVFCLIAFNGCVVISDSPFRVIDGKDYPLYKINNIAKGKSTKSDILEMFGKPYLEYNGKWVYYYIKENKGWLKCIAYIPNCQAKK